MKTISGAMTTHIAQEVTTLAMCWECTRADGNVYGFTTHDRDLEIGGVTFEAISGFLPSQMQWTASLAVDNLEAIGMLDSQAITEEDIRNGLWDFALIEIFYVNWSSLSDGVVNQVRGRLGEVKTGKHHFSAELRGLAQRLQQQHGRLISAACDADLGDTRCGVNLAPLTVTGTLTGVGANPRKSFFDSSRSEANAWFDNGRITFTSGPNDGFSMEVKAYFLSGGSIVTQLALPYDAAVGDTYSMTPGCFKRFTEDCIGKFSNVRRFRGFPDVPGLDRVASGT